MRKNLLVAVLTFFTMIVVIAVKGHAGSDDTPMVRTLSRIGNWMRTNAPGIEQGLHAPVQRLEIDALAKLRGVKVPEEVYSLYTWHDGAGANTLLFGEYRFLPIAEAFAYGDAMHAAFPAEPYRLPLFRSSVSSAAYTADCLPADHWETPVKFVYDGAITQTETLTGFLSVLAQSYEKGGSAFSSVVFERSLLDARPLRKNAVDEILAGDSDRLKPDAEMTAYADLLAIQHPQTEKFITEAAGRWSDDENYSFSTMEMLARLDTPGAWDTLQKLVRSPNPATRKRAYSMVAFWWPNDGRKLDAATEDIAIQDLTAETYNNLDRRTILRVLLRAPDTWVPAVAAALANPEKDTRVAAAQTLGILGDQRGTPLLLAQATKDSDEDVRAACYHALADLGDPAAEQQLLASMTKSDPQTLAFARQAGSPAAVRVARQLLETRRP